MGNTWAPPVEVAVFLIQICNGQKSAGMQGLIEFIQNLPDIHDVVQGHTAEDKVKPGLRHQAIAQVILFCDNVFNPLRPDFFFKDLQQPLFGIHRR